MEPRIVHKNSIWMETVDKLDNLPGGGKMQLNQ